MPNGTNGLQGWDNQYNGKISAEVAIKLINIIEDLMVVQSPDDLSDIVTRDVKKIMPHEIAIFSLGDSRIKSGDYVLNMGYPTNFLHEISESQSGRDVMKSPVIDATIKSDIGFIKVEETLSFNPHYEQWTEAAKKHSIHDMLATIKMHQDSSLGSYFCFTNQGKYHDQTQKRIIKILAPFFDSALVKIANLDKSYNPFNITEREKVILNFLIEGELNKVISARLGISLQTVKHHVSSIMRKLNAKNRTQVADIARSAGFTKSSFQ